MTIRIVIYTLLVLGVFVPPFQSSTVGEQLAAINTACSYGWLVGGDPCTMSTSITCSGGYITQLNLYTPINASVIPTLPILDAFTNLTHLTVQDGINIPDNFWSNSLNSMKQLVSLSLANVVNISSADVSFFPTSLNLLTFQPKALPAELFNSTKLTELTITYPFAIPFPLIIGYTYVSKLTLYKFPTDSSFINENQNYSYFVNLNYLYIGQPLVWTWNSFDKIQFKYLYFAGNGTPVSQSLYSSVFSCLNLETLSVTGSFFSPLIDPLDLTSQPNLKTLYFSGGYLSQVSSPGIKVKATGIQFNLYADPILHSFKNIDFSQFPDIFAANFGITDSLVNNRTYYANKTTLVLSGNGISTPLPDAFCYAQVFNVIGNSFSDLPNCFKCSPVYVGPSVSPFLNNSYMQTYSDFACPTFQIKSFTKLFDTTGGTMYVNGVDLGWTITESMTSSSLIVPNEYFQLNISAGVGTGLIRSVQFHAGEQNMQTFNFSYGYYPPYPIAFTSLGATTIQIIGKYFGNDPSKITVTQNTTNIIVATASQTSLQLSYTPPSSTFTKLNINVGGQSADFVVDTLNRPPIVIVPNVLSFSGGSTQITGNSFSVDPTLFNMTIDGLPCTITFSSIGSVNFTYPPFTSYGLKTLVLNVIDGNKILYQTGASVFVSSPIPQCVSKNHGTCNANNTLVCDQGWTGNDCNSQIIVVNPSKNDDAPTTSINSTTTLSNGEDVKFSSLISIVEVREYNGITGEPVKYYPINKWFVETVSSNEYKYSTNISKDGSSNTTILVDIKYFPSEETIQFANESITMNPSTIKYQIELSPYQFSTSYNRLMIVLSAQFDRSESDTTCSSVQNGQDQTSLDYDYLKLQVNEISLYSKFIKFGIIDQRKSYISNTFLNSTQQSNQIISLVGINVPYYLNSVILDPDFSVLIDSNSVTDTDSDSVCSSLSSSSKKLSKQQLAGIIIGSVAGFVIISLIIGFVLYKKFRYSSTLLNIKDKMNMKMKKRKEGTTTSHTRNTAPLYTGGKIQNVDDF